MAAKSSGKASKLNYKAESRWIDNAKRRQGRHEMLELSKSERKEQLHSLIAQAIEQYKMGDKGVYTMKRIIGTLNIRRVSLFLSGRIEFENWFKARRCPKHINELRAGTKIPEAIISAMRPYKDKPIVAESAA